MKAGQTVVSAKVFLDRQICQCCGSYIEDETDIKGPFELGPYKTVCKKCWSSPFLHFPDKKIMEDGLSYPSTDDEPNFPDLRLWSCEIEKQKMNVLLVEPNYYTRFPPLGLLKISSFHKLRGDAVVLVRFPDVPKVKPDMIYVTSLFTYSWKKVHESVRYYKHLFPSADLILGGVYASLLPDHAMKSGADYIHVGLFQMAEDCIPDYSTVSEIGWNSNILFSSRGCIRACGFCAVPKLEGGISSKKTILNHIDKGLRKIVLWDNNILATRNWRNVFGELEDLQCTVDFNQGFDARLMTPEVAERLSRLKTKSIRLAFDNSVDRGAVYRAISLLKKAGVRSRKIVVYTLFNYSDDPSDFLERIRKLLLWGVVSYPMRYEPLCVLKKNEFISKTWNASRLNLLQRARRVIGCAGTFPPYLGLIKKLCSSKGFDEAFELRPSFEEIRKVLRLSDEESVRLVYAYYYKHNLTTSKLPLQVALATVNSQRILLSETLGARRKNRELKRMRGSLDWRSTFILKKTGTEMPRSAK